MGEKYRLKTADLDKIGIYLREIYADVMARMQLKATNVVQRNLGDRVQHMTHSFKSKPLPGGL